ncbi:hypothetical protein FGU65_08775 [Methanoculleus sp. FWC-SCC1]|uniref:Uncharacterized protein n=1 Tax=Methanoculleus frigidifontis TaxID=2584085 RepID=A0ABT8MAL2_9EURY|nr:hypothetical protein [Methanoculleus sp. FWC-SCC1]MDN7024978.1 hypothetical protein [Methanoculleus sp. FWC-SCC1]
MDYRALLHPARVKPLTAWSIGGSLIGIGAAARQARYVGVDWPLLLIALGDRVDAARQACLRDGGTKLEASTGALRPGQFYLSIAYSFALPLVRLGVSVHHDPGSSRGWPL